MCLQLQQIFTCMPFGTSWRTGRLCALSRFHLRAIRAHACPRTRVRRLQLLLPLCQAAAATWAGRGTQPPLTQVRFSHLQAPPDAILGISEAFKADNSPEKLNLGVGAYRTEARLPGMAA
jgi:hypothetical protein